MIIFYLPAFVKSYRKLPADLRAEAKEKIELFKKEPNHPFLKTHKLKGTLFGRFGFSVNYSHRIVFQYLSKTEVALLAIGTHEIYK
ncbi:type II toxin-antitoxin system mRNA interferase toxin, RelE/StbE family [Candidatus Peregrinibacteria bacterium CG_4_10_14_0_2_um_filter_38_24]|nr:MAG: type II toxin-antitoxin system mRNA interferase toxin, RelE/StbE family [Candidatus Peregrinibacteria bacterium CG_4_10_14_0_2_um_filter_38_24]PJC38982.1 MAG: type II toxin-antitoxin system mRNA interferase toxin, RelE/StbE family [Candidatus Peregrinibacteria bacterium CG_4_9_14_0_2_um_filter_38_9]